MRIDSPLMTNAVATGSFSGSFTGAFDGDITADSVAYANVSGKPALVSSSAQITAFGFSTTDNELTQEEVEDFAGALVATGGTKTGITVTYDDANGNMDFVVASQTDENFTTADHAKLDGIEASADVTDATNVTAAGALMDSEVTNLAAVKAFDGSDYATAAQGTKADSAQQPPSEGAFANGDKTKLDGIEASADVTDTANVTAAGALMDSELTDLAGVKGVTISTLQVKPSEGAFADCDKTKLDAIEASADVTDATNVTAAGALMDSECTNLAALKAINQGLATGNDVQFNDLTVAGDLTVTGTTTSINSTDLDVTDKLISINKGGADAASANGGGLFISGANESMTWDNGNSRFNFSDDLHAAGNFTLSGTVDGRDVASDGTKLDGIESSATADQTDAEIRAAVEAASDSNVFTDADHTKLNGIEASATADQTNAEIKAAVEAASDSNTFTDADHTKLDGIEASADVTDTTNVTAAGALMDSECSSLASVKAINQGLTTSSDVSFDSIGIGTAAPGTSGVIRAANDIVAFYSSDERLKDNIEVIPNCLGRLKDIKVVEFDWNDKQSVYQGHDIGVIAQDIEKIAPSLVTDRDNGFKAVKYEKLTAILIQAVKELAAKVEELENK